MIGQSICSIFTSVFLNGKLNVFMEQPPSYEVSAEICKSIDRLKRARCKWYKIVCRTLADLGFKKREADPAGLYIDSGKRIIHIDGCTVTGLSHALFQQQSSKSSPSMP
jgi:hypothetical protein